MGVSAVRVPVALLLDRRLLPSDKLVWLALHSHMGQGRVNVTLLRTASGLSRPTVRKAVARLVAAGWVAGTSALATVDRDPGVAWVSLPQALVGDQGVRVQARLLYGALQWTPGFRQQGGSFTYTQLCGLLGLSRNTVKACVRELVQAGWLTFSQCHQLAPVCFTLRDPAAEQGEMAVARARRRLETADFLGEALMREYLSLIVDSNRFEDDAAPGFLVNPYTDERLQLDRYYTQHGVAFEFNGPQHYGPTQRYTKEEAARQRGRDYVKLEICVTEGISLRVVHAEDLSLAGMQAKVGEVLPRRVLRGHERLVAYLESVSRRYRRAARRGLAAGRRLTSAAAGVWLCHGAGLASVWLAVEWQAMVGLASVWLAIAGLASVWPTIVGPTSAWPAGPAGSPTNCAVPIKFSAILLHTFTVIPLHPHLPGCPFTHSCRGAPSPAGTASSACLGLT